MLRAWLALELRMLRFLRYLYRSRPGKTYSIRKYFIIQRIGSLSLLIGLGLIRCLVEGPWARYILILALLIKTGIPPFHGWFVTVIEEISWDSIFLLSTIQKVLPFFLLIHIGNNILLVVARLRGLIGGLGIFSQVRVKKIIAFSSITGRAWVVRVSPNFRLAISYLLVYRVGLLVWIWGCTWNSRLHVLEVHTQEKNFISVILVLISLLRLAGFPPMLGFFMKIRLFQHLLTRHERASLLLLRLTPVLFIGYFRVILWDLKIRGSELGFKPSNKIKAAFSTIAAFLLLGGGLLYLSLSTTKCAEIWPLRLRVDSKVVATS